MPIVIFLIVALICYFLLFPLFAFLALLLIIATNILAFPPFLRECIGISGQRTIDRSDANFAAFCYGLATFAVLCYALIPEYQQWPYVYVGIGATATMIITLILLLNVASNEKWPRWYYGIIQSVAAVLGIVFAGRIVLMRFGIML